MGLRKNFSNFRMLHESTISYTVTGQKIKRGAGLALDIPVMYQARENEKALKWLEKVINKIQADDLAS